MMTTRPFADQDSCAAIQDATATLSADRADEWAGDITVEIHILASLRLQLDHHLRSAINTALNCGYQWHHVAELLGETTNQARRRYNRKPQPAHRPQT